MPGVLGEINGEMWVGVCFFGAFLVCLVVGGGGYYAWWRVEWLVIYVAILLSVSFFFCRCSF